MICKGKYLTMQHALEGMKKRWTKRMILRGAKNNVPIYSLMWVLPVYFRGFLILLGHWVPSYFQSVTFTDPEKVWPGRMHRKVDHFQKRLLGDPSENKEPKDTNTGTPSRQQKWVRPWGGPWNLYNVTISQHPQWQKKPITAKSQCPGTVNILPT